MQKLHKIGLVCCLVVSPILNAMPALAAIVVNTKAVQPGFVDLDETYDIGMTMDDFNIRFGVPDRIWRSDSPKGSLNYGLEEWSYFGNGIQVQGDQTDGQIKNFYFFIKPSKSSEFKRADVTFDFNLKSMLSYSNLLKRLGKPRSNQVVARERFIRYDRGHYYLYFSFDQTGHLATVGLEDKAYRDSRAELPVW